jgi:hypothetical protein
VGSAPTLPVFINFGASARANNASLSRSTASSPHRVVIFDSVDGAGTDPFRLSRQKIRHVPELVLEVQEHHPEVHRHRDARPAQQCAEVLPERCEKRLVV